MRNLWGRFLWAFLLASATAANLSAAPSEIVVAIRYLLQTGASHAHLYLYREDGTLLRQLTKDDGGQDRNPVFAPDGETIVFTRELPGGVKQSWSVEPRGGNLKQLPTAPEWYQQGKDSPHFASPPETASAESMIPSEKVRPVFRVDVGSEVVLTPTPTSTAGEGNPDEWTVSVRARSTGKEIPLGKMSGWAPRPLLAQGRDPAESSLVEGALRVAFITTSLGSMDGTTVYAAGPGKPGLARLARNWAMPYPLPGEDAFLTFAEERYVPFGDGAHFGELLVRRPLGCPFEAGALRP